MKRIIYLLPLLAAFQTQAQSISPSVMNANGGQKVIAGNTYEWSVGEMTLVNTTNTPGLIVTNGVLQPAETTAGIDDFTFGNGQMDVYPNPAEKEVFIQPELPPNTKMQMTLTDILGKMLMQSEVMLSTGHEKQIIDLRTYPAGNYMLMIRAEDKAGQRQAAYKIQKN